MRQPLTWFCGPISPLIPRVALMFLPFWGSRHHLNDSSPFLKPETGQIWYMNFVEEIRSYIMPYWFIRWHDWIFQFPPLSVNRRSHFSSSWPHWRRQRPSSSNRFIPFFILVSKNLENVKYELCWRNSSLHYAALIYSMTWFIGRVWLSEYRRGSAPSPLGWAIEWTTVVIVPSIQSVLMTIYPKIYKYEIWTLLKRCEATRCYL